MHVPSVLTSKKLQGSIFVLGLEQDLVMHLGSPSIRLKALEIVFHPRPRPRPPLLAFVV